MDIAESTVLEIWDLFCDFVPSGKKNDVAVKFLRLFVEQDISLDDLDDARGEDEHLDHAFEELSDDDGDGYGRDPEYED